MRHRLRLLALSVVALGMLLHFYIAAFKASGGLNSYSTSLMYMAWVPYVVCGVVIAFSKNSIVPLGGAVAALVMDTVIFLSVFVWPQGSTGSIALIFMPYWNLLFFVPVGMLIGWVVNKYWLRRQHAL